MPCLDFPTGLEEIASFERLSGTVHLSYSVNVIGQHWQH